MTAFFVAIRNAVIDPQEMAIYAEKVPLSIAGHQMSMKAHDGRLRSTDGRPVEGATIVEFPTFEAAQAWYDSPSYQDALIHRIKGGDYQTFIIESIHK